MNTPALLWGCLIDNSPDPAALDALVGRTGKPPSIIVFGRSAMSNGTYFQPSSLSWALKTIRGRGAYAMLDLFTRDGLNPAWSLQSITAGTHDVWLRNLATFLASLGYPIFLRLDGEMNLSDPAHWMFCEWAGPNAGQGSGQFVRMWRHVVDLFRAQGATNVTWVWCPNILSPTAPPLEQLYPGDDYVDWLAVDGYNWFTADGSSWQTFDQVFTGYQGISRDTWAELVALGVGEKPIIIGETGCHTDGRKAAWITDALSKCRRPPFSDRLRGFLYFDAADPKAHWQLEGDSAKAFRAAIADDAFQTGGPGQVLQTGMAPITPLTSIVPVPPPVPDQYRQYGATWDAVVARLEQYAAEDTAAASAHFAELGLQLVEAKQDASASKQDASDARAALTQVQGHLQALVQLGGTPTP